MNRDQFFSDCAASYPTALLALACFRHYVQGPCQEVLKSHAGELGAAIGHPQADFKIAAYPPPSQSSSENPDSLYLGAKGKDAKGKCEIWAYFYWERESKNKPFQVGVGFDIWPASQAKREAYESAIDAAVYLPPFDSEDSWGWALGSESDVSFYVELQQGELLDFAKELDRLVGKAAEVLRSVTNVDRFFRK